MTEALKRKSTLGVKAEGTYGEDPTLASADVIEVEDFMGNDNFEEIERNVIRNTFDELEPVRGVETTDGEILLELHGSGTNATAPESDPLWLSAIGPKNVNTGSGTAITGGDANTIKLTTGDVATMGLVVGDAVMLDVDDTGGDYEVVWITGIATEDLTVSPAMSGTPAVGATVYGGVHYKISTAELGSFWASYWRGDLVREDYKGCKIEEVTFDFTSGQPVRPVFRWMGKEMADPETEAYGLGTPSYDTGRLHVARYMALKVGGVTYGVSSLALSIANEQVRLGDVTVAGTSKVVRVRRTITGSFSLRYENKDVEDNFRNEVTAELIVVSSRGGQYFTLGDTFAIRMPKIKYTAAGKEEADGIYSYNVPFKAVMTLGEDSITSNSFL